MPKVKTKTIVEYEVDYERARTLAEEIGRSISHKYPDISYDVEIQYGEGAYLKLYGDEERIRRIADARRRHQLDWILAGTPVYFVYWGPTEPESASSPSKTKKKAR